MQNIPAEKIAANVPSVPKPAAHKVNPSITLQENLTIRHIAQVYADLKSRLDLNAPVTLDLSRVTQMDTAGMQMLLALKRQLAKNTHPLKLVGLTEDSKASMQIAGFDRELLA
jgi:anti-anti-sigma regulatory factor